MFENTALVERFLNYWRTTGHQRMGFLYGSYEVNNDVPLGIRAHVAAIYEPPQESTRNSIKLLVDERADEIDDIATKLGLQKVGWIFTDLIADNAALGTVKHIRGIETHFLTAQECIMAGHLQNQHPNVCKYSSNGTFGSKFVTVCVTGTFNINSILYYHWLVYSRLFYSLLFKVIHRNKCIWKGMLYPVSAWHWFVTIVWCRLKMHLNLATSVSQPTNNMFPMFIIR